MWRKPLAGLLLLGGAAGGPYFLFETDAGSQARSGAWQLFGGSAAPPAGQLTSVSPDDGASGFWNANGTNSPQSMPLIGSESYTPPPVHALREVLRFDVSPTWVTQRFSRVTTVLADTQLDGLRVPLVTGTQPTDIAGTLTYYFDRFQRVQRVTVHGVTGDPSRFVAELQHAYQLQQQPSLGGGLYLRKWNGRPTNIVYTTLAPIITADSPYSRYNLMIELNQAGLEYGLSAEAQQLLDAGRHANRWQ